MAFTEIIGQEHGLGLVRSCLKKGRLPHSYLFVGPRGVGKTMAAVSLAQALNCEEVDEGCGKCRICMKIEKFGSPDFNMIEPGGPARVISINQIRMLRREINLSPVESKYKTFFIKDADRMNEESSNAILKVLEEPPDKSMIVLSTFSMSSLLPTIISRCQVVFFKRLKHEQVLKILLGGGVLDSDKAYLSAGLSEGSPGRAFDLIDGGFDERERVLSVLAGEEFKDTENILRIAEEESSRFSGNPLERREKSLIFLEMVMSWYRDLLMILSGGEILNQDYASQLRRISGSFSVSQIKSVLELCIEARRWLEFNTNLRLVFEVFFLRLREIILESRSSMENSLSPLRAGLHYS